MTNDLSAVININTYSLNDSLVGLKGELDSFIKNNDKCEDVSFLQNRYFLKLSKKIGVLV